MIPRAALERNMMYVRARELGAPLQHVMSVMLHADDIWRSGISLYRADGRSFTEHERDLLQSLTPAFVNTVRNCRRFGTLAARGRLIDRVLADEQRALVVLDDAGHELARTPGAAQLLALWSGSEPILPALAEQARVRLAGKGDAACLLLRRPAAGKELVARAHALTEAGRRHLVLTFEEVQLAPPIPSSWGLTRREREVAALIMLGSSNLNIATLLDCAEETVTKHAQHIFAKAKVSRRAELAQRAWSQLD
jgi:DNA-binding CsgD family transcriptional regulator